MGGTLDNPSVRNQTALSMHPDGQRLAYAVEERGGTEVWTLENFLSKTK